MSSPEHESPRTPTAEADPLATGADNGEIVLDPDAEQPTEEARERHEAITESIRRPSPEAAADVDTEG